MSLPPTQQTSTATPRAAAGTTAAAASLDVGGGDGRRGSEPPYSKRVLISFGASLLCMLSAGTIYLFSAYAPDLARHLSLTQTEVNIVASVGGYGMYLAGPVTGYIADNTAIRPLVLVSAVFLATGYFGMAWTYSGFFPWAAVLSLSVFYGFVGLGSSGVCNATLSAIVRNFRAKDRGMSVGLSLAFFGLSAFFFSQISSLFMSKGDPPMLDTYSYLEVVGLIVGGLPLLCSLVLVDNKTAERPAAAAIRRTTTAPASETDSLLPTTSPSSSHTAQPAPSAAASRSTFSPPFVRSLDGLLLLLTFLLAAGPGLMYINNIGTVVDTLTPPSTDSTPARRLQVSLISIFNCLGRILMGVLSDVLSSRFGVPRMYGLAVGVGLIGVAHAGVAGFATDLAGVTVCTVVMGLGYGSMFAAFPAIVSLLFGASGFGSNWGWFQLAPALGGQLCNILFGAIVDRARSDGCSGPACYSKAFYITAGAALGSSLLMLIVERLRRRRLSRARE
ncbi:major facilitator superfamily domain-containing protein [Zopfochytrium polystomum]|nr:major facilitator superfamily domain-containing protein [Zopfochytrium polystomum]